MSDSTLQEARFDFRESLRDLANKLEAGAISDKDAIEAVMVNLARFDSKVRRIPKHATE